MCAYTSAFILVLYSREQLLLCFILVHSFYLTLGGIMRRAATAVHWSCCVYAKFSATFSIFAVRIPYTNAHVRIQFVF